MQDQAIKGGYDEFYLERNPAEQARYDKKAKGYGRKLGGLLDACGAVSAVDLGCGSGLLCGYLVSRGCREVVGVDANGPLLDVARRHVPAGEFVQDDVVHYAAACGRKFDVVFMMNLLEHIPAGQVRQLLEAVRELLNDGGYALVRTPNFGCLVAPAHFHRDFTHCTPFTEQTLRQVAREAGFARVEFCNQFRMQNVGGKVRACLNWLVHRAMFWLAGGAMPKVYYRNLYSLLVK